jgi:hypothetical protein
MKLMNYCNLLLIACCFFILVNNSDAQTKAKNVRISPRAWVGQTIGLTDVNVVYGRPGVKNRKIWGELVPFNKVWRAGADEATRFTFSTDVTIEGKKLPKGSYSFFVIPGEKEWTVIFNKVADQWGAFEYNEAEDILRFKVKPQKADYTEWLDYDIERTSESGATVSLQWEKLSVTFKIEGSSK